MLKTKWQRMLVCLAIYMVGLDVMAWSARGFDFMLWVLAAEVILVAVVVLVIAAVGWVMAGQ